MLLKVTLLEHLGRVPTACSAWLADERNTKIFENKQLGTIYISTATVA